MSGPTYNKDTGRWELPDRRRSPVSSPPTATIEPQRASEGRLWGIVGYALAFLAGAGAGVFLDQWDLSAWLDAVMWWTP